MEVILKEKKNAFQGLWSQNLKQQKVISIVHT